jgi:hypothetical protein
MSALVPIDKVSVACPASDVRNRSPADATARAGEDEARGRHRVVLRESWWRSTGARGVPTRTCQRRGANCLPPNDLPDRSLAASAASALSPLHVAGAPLRNPGGDARRPSTSSPGAAAAVRRRRGRRGSGNCLARADERGARGARALRADPQLERHAATGRAAGHLRLRNVDVHAGRAYGFPRN